MKREENIRQKQNIQNDMPQTGMSIARLAFSNNIQNKTRSIFVTVSICFTMMLLVIVSSYGYGMLRSQKVNAGLSSGSHYGYIKRADAKQISQMELRGEFDEIGLMALTALTQNDGAMYYADETALAFNNMQNRLAEGAYPEKGNEIAAGAAFLKECGVSDPKVGDKARLQRRFNMETPFEAEEYTISGLVKENEVGTGIYRAVFVSKEYFEHSVPRQEREYNAYFSLAPFVEINTDNAEEVIKELAALVGADEKNVNVNKGYLNWYLNAGYETITVCALIIGCIVLFSVLVIYNIFQVGIVQKIREYGKLRAIGATKQQMRKLIFLEGMYMTVIGIPIGLILGIVTASLSFDWLMRLERVYRPAGYTFVSPISPAIVFLAAVICFLTVCLALYRPIRLVSSVSPVEAVRYQEGSTVKHSRSTRRGKRQMRVFDLTLANLAAQKKRTVMTIITMGLSCTLFVVIANLGGNLDTEYDARKQVEFGDFQIELDYSIGDKAYPENNLDAILKNNPLDQEFLNELRALDGVARVDTQRILCAQLLDKNGQASEKSYSVLVLDRETFEKELKEGGGEGDFSYDSVSQNSGIVWGMRYFMEEEGIVQGDSKKILLTDGIQEKTMEAQMAGSFGMASADWIITEETYRSLGFAGDPIYKVWISCERKTEASVEEQIRTLLENKEHLEMKTYADVLSTSKTAVGMMKLFAYVLSGMIAVISFLNMANTLVVSAVTRRQEFGLMQAIGMTNAQLNASLQGEGLLFTVGTVAVSMLVGIPCGYGLFRYGKADQMFGLNQYHLPVRELLVMAIFLALFQTVLSFVLTRSVKRESVIERIRYHG
ncbi:MAG: ABC transporter permease [Lachnospiraceae bacterium]|nr:ABC transporter permease [Lachnospiraceae bacterium]